MFVPIMIGLIGAAAAVVGVVLWAETRGAKKGSASNTGESPAADLVPEVSLEEFQALVASPDKAVAVMFFASWCPACGRQSPFFREAAKDLAGAVTFVRMDTDKCKPFARQLVLKKIPTTLVFKGSDKPLGALVGVHPPGVLKSFITETLTPQ